MNLKRYLLKAKKSLFAPKYGEIWCLHRVVEQRSIYPSNRELEITPDYLEKLIKDYKHKGYRFVTLDEIVTSVNGKRKYGQAKRCAITFDDGFVDIYTYAWPILQREKVPFTIYLTTGMPDGTACLWWEQMARMDLSVEEFEVVMKEIYASPENMTETFLRKFQVEPDRELTKDLSLSWNQIKEMVVSGLCMIGSHTVSHTGLNRLPLEQVRDELLLSRQRIEQMLDVKTKHFSYPHSMTNAEVETLVKDCECQSATLGYGGGVRYGDNPYKLNRKYIIER